VSEYKRNCPDCGHENDNRSISCFECGVIMGEQEPKPVCEQCGEIIHDDNYFRDDQGVNFHKTKECLSWQESVVEEDSFKLSLARLINQHSLENGSDTPDFILADYLCQCLAVFNVTTKERKRWYE